MTRTELHELIDSIPDDKIEALELLIREMLVASIPEDHEELTPEEQASIDEAWEEYRRTGKTYTSEEIRQELGLWAAK